MKIALSKKGFQKGVSGNPMGKFIEFTQIDGKSSFGANQAV